MYRQRNVSATDGKLVLSQGSRYGSPLRKAMTADPHFPPSEVAQKTKPATFIAGLVNRSENGLLGAGLAAAALAAHRAHCTLAAAF